ncbi:MAG: hypothetical protein JXR91_00065 [Deltaproteobacteria bacterium]|nr:hypothetical protein [Deltaproteobacteria bacterium]
MFSLFIRRDGLIEPPQIGETDHHCHILCGIDDGPATMEGSVNIAKILLSMGIKTVTATPHIISDLYPNTPAGIRQSVEELQNELIEKNLPLKVVAGAEYYAEQSFLESIEQNALLSFGDEKYVLFECPVETEPMILESIIFQLKSNGYTPLLAHAERYHFLQRDFKLAAHLKNLGVHFQVNHPSFLLPKTTHTGEMARKLYIKGFVNVLGTDMHRATSAKEIKLAPKRSLFNLFN